MTPPDSPYIRAITAALAATYPSFGGGKTSQWNPIAAALKDHPAQFAAGVPIADVVAAVLAAAFLTMPEPPDDMGSPEGLAAYADAVLEWRALHGFPSTYDGPTAAPEVDPLKWWAVHCHVVCEEETLESGIVYVRARTASAADFAAKDHVHDTWGTADARINYRVDTDTPEEQDETDPRFNRPESVFTDDGRTHPGV